MSETPIYCSFCGKSNIEARCIVAGPTVYICDECVQACVDVLFDKGIRIQPAVDVEQDERTAPSVPQIGERK
jgi:ATP-dependent Clp protease ATP-binding subunit ClpX